MALAVQRDFRALVDLLDEYTDRGIELELASIRAKAERGLALSSRLLARSRQEMAANHG
jgi:hypothetical protein